MPRQTTATRTSSVVATSTFAELLTLPTTVASAGAVFVFESRDPHAGSAAPRPAAAAQDRTKRLMGRTPGVEGDSSRRLADPYPYDARGGPNCKASGRFSEELPIRSMPSEGLPRVRHGIPGRVEVQVAAVVLRRQLHGVVGRDGREGQRRAADSMMDDGAAVALGIRRELGFEGRQAAGSRKLVLAGVGDLAGRDAHRSEILLHVRDERTGAAPSWKALLGSSGVQ